MTDTPDLTDTVAIVLAGAEGRGLHELTDRDSLPALPFARYHRVVDFALASLARSGVGRVIVATQDRPARLTAHLREVWTPVWPEAGLILRHGPDLAQGVGCQGTADILRANAPLLDAMGTREVLVTSGEQIHALEHRDLVAAHRAARASLTLAAVPVPRQEASRYDVVTVGPGKRIAGIAERPEQPAASSGDPTKSLVSIGTCVIDWSWLRGLLQDLSVRDLRANVIPRAVHRGEAAVWDWQGYWRDIDSLDGFREGWLGFEASPPPCRRPLVQGMRVRRLHEPAPRDPFHVSLNLGGLRLMSPLVGTSDPNRWTAMDRSVLMPGARVSAGVRLSNVIVAPGAVIPQGLHIGEDPEEDRRWFRVAGSTTLVTSAMLARRGALRTRVFSLFPGKQGLSGTNRRMT